MMIFKMCKQMGLFIMMTTHSIQTKFYKTHALI